MFAALAGCVLLLGCHGSDDRRAAASGTVRIGGEPLVEGAISFFPIEGTSGPSAGGIIEQGEYSIPRSQGVAVGRNRVEIRGFRNTGRKVPDIWDPNRMLDERVHILDAEYNDRSTLVREVQPGANRFDFDLPRSRGE